MSAPFLPRSVGRSLLDKLDVAATVPDLRRRFAIIPEPERNPPPFYIFLLSNMPPPKTVLLALFLSLFSLFSLFLSLSVVRCSVSLSLRSFLSRLGGHPNLFWRFKPPLFTSFFFPICRHPKPCFSTLSFSLLIYLSFSPCLSFRILFMSRVPSKPFPVPQTLSFLHLSSFQHATTQNRG